MKQCKQMGALLSGYADGALDEQERQEVEAHLAQCGECAADLAALRRCVRLLRSIPMPEPTIELWPEFVRKLDDAEAEVRLGPLMRLELAWQRAAGHFAEGVVVYTHILASNTLRRMEKYLIRNPFEVVDY